MIPLEDDGAPAPGIYPGIDFSEYASWSAANASTVAPYLRSAAHGHYAELHPRQTTDAQSLGTAAHTAILEPERFHGMIVRPARLDAAGRGKAAQQARTNWERMAAGHEWVTEDERNLAVSMRDAIHNHATAVDILKAPGIREVCIVWVDFEYGVKCKARFDLLSLWNGYRIIGDLKSTQDARPEYMARSLNKFGYSHSAAWYIAGANALDPQERNFVLLAVESEEPHGVCVYQLDGSDLQSAHDEMRLAFDRYVKGHKTGIFPSYDEGMGILTSPGWKKRYFGDQS